MKPSHVTLRRAGSLATVVVLTGIMASSGGPASGVAIRTDTTLGGYSIKTSGAPFRVLLDDPTLAVPHEPGTPVLEADPAYTAARLETGPASRGLSSMLWPGSLFGDGMGTITNGQIAAYPIKADARYPDKPYTATAQDNGAFMQASALGLDVRALARVNPGDVPGQVDVGAMSSLSTATVKDGVAIGTGESHASNLSLLGGIIKVGSVSSTITVKADGKKATSSGSTAVTGLTIAGVGFVVDQDGARPVGTPVDQGTGPLPSNALDPLKQLGITVSGIAQSHTQDATGATRDAAGLRITVNTVVLRGVLNQLPPELWAALYGIVDKMPPEAQGNLYYLLGATPEITFVLGAGSGTVAATLPLSFQFPDVPVPGAFPPPVTGGGVTAPLPGTVGTGTVTPPSDPVAPGPVVVPPTTPSLAKAAVKDPFKG
ncbi:MAG: hypothetical protein M3P04_03080, partial [Actinomycetota bacterium]|nr:hypothetical protein [Actinomycetota bacterium]